MLLSASPFGGVGSNIIFHAHWGNIDVFMAASKRSAERGKTNAESPVGFGEAVCELRHRPTLQGVKNPWGLYVQQSRGLELCNPR